MYLSQLSSHMVIIIIYFVICSVVSMLSFSLLFYLLNLFWHLVLLYFCSISYIHMKIYALLFSSAQSISHVWLFETPWTVACQASLSITNSQSLRRLMSIELVMPSKHLILCHPLPLLPSVFPSTRGFSSKSVLCIRWPKYCSFSFSISPSKEYAMLNSLWNLSFYWKTYITLWILCFRVRVLQGAPDNSEK